MDVAARKPQYITDSLIILVNCSASYSVLPYILFHIYNRVIFIIIIGLINVAYLLYKYRSCIELPYSRLFYIYFILNLWNTYAGMFSNSGFISSFTYLFTNTSFFVLLYNLYLDYRIRFSQKKSIWLIVRGYVCLVIICIISVFITFLITKSGLNLYNLDISLRYDLFQDNVATLGHSYYAPFGLGILLVTKGLSLRIPFFSENGIICGIYHEPHVLTFMVFPCIFIMWAYAKTKQQKIFIFFSALLVMLVASSTTNLIVALICVCVALFYSKNGKYILFPILGVVVLLIFYIGLENTELFFVVDKLEDSGGSKGYTMDALEFAFIPKTIVGSNVLNTSFIQDLGVGRRDAGIITVILNVIFLTGCYIKLYQLIKSNRFNCMLGVGVLYFMLHSIKTNMTTYTSSILMLCLFLLIYTRFTPMLRNEIVNYEKIKKDFIE